MWQKEAVDVGEMNKKRVLWLSPKGLALGDFAFRDGPALGLSDMEAYRIAKQLIEQWDGSESLLQIYQRTEQWPEEIAPCP